MPHGCGGPAARGCGGPFPPRAPARRDGGPYDASPAAFSVHARSRDASQAIVDQYLRLEPDVLMGGGADFFLPAQQAGGRRDDRTDVLAAFAAELERVVGQKNEALQQTR